tara:strand:+ start:314 stop:1153 length:840 start_codon:yes stop_codon:yes gene_type:complete
MQGTVSFNNLFYQLDPLPTTKELDEFYKKKYHDIAASKSRPEDVLWLEQTQFKDISEIIKGHLSPSKIRLLDVGSGDGSFIKYLGKNGFETLGIEPDQKVKTNEAYCGNLTEARKEMKELSGYFDVVSMLNVLEHMKYPGKSLEQASFFLRDNGLLIVKVPNDFTSLQASAKNQINAKKQWWISRPDHINYFNSFSIQKFLERNGFEIVYIMSDYPMEFFLLQGENYIGNPKIGKKCHRKRVMFEMSLNTFSRTKIYNAFAKAGIGRNIIVFAKKVKIK